MKKVYEIFSEKLHKRVFKSSQYQKQIDGTYKKLPSAYRFKTKERAIEIAERRHIKNYKIEEVDTFTYDQLLRGMTLAEYILNTNPTYGEFKLGFPWDKQGNAAIPNPPKPMTHNQKKMTVPMEQLQENSTNNAKSALNKTLKETNGQEPKKTFDWQNDN